MGTAGGRCVLAGVAAAFLLVAALPLPARAIGEDKRPYDEKLLRLSEILGALHFLRELCGSEEGQLWRQQMTELVEAEASSAIRRVRLINSFNKGYRSFRRTYQECNGSAETAIGRFIAEGAEIATDLAEGKPAGEPSATPPAAAGEAVQD